MFDAAGYSLIMPGYSPMTTTRKIFIYEIVGLSSEIDVLGDNTAPNGFGIVPLSTEVSAPLGFPYGVLVEEIPIVDPVIRPWDVRPVYNFVFWGRAKVRLDATSAPVRVGQYVKAHNFGKVTKATIGQLALARVMSNGEPGDLINVLVNPGIAHY